ncbi:hypothetical protein RSOLAG22IIIB_10440 [Rhizoctonia solani]|uniref:Uncharacterized protein n=1 Tax=Rhizoctonia solani TaxID=456999 RepID=A0A0K6G3N0_9AGAM|nr:hypothetical protein RSOLAG22IIIB_10440 [Rhizoctonia solani]
METIPATAHLDPPGELSSINVLNNCKNFLVKPEKPEIGGIEGSINGYLSFAGKQNAHISESPDGRLIIEFLGESGMVEATFTSDDPALGGIIFGIVTGLWQ